MQTYLAILQQPYMWHVLDKSFTASVPRLECFLAPSHAFLRYYHDRTMSLPLVLSVPDEGLVLDERSRDDRMVRDAGFPSHFITPL